MAAGKKTGRKSQASNDFLEPLTPTIDGAVDVGIGRAFNNGAVDVSFTLPALSPAATSYTVTSSPGGLTATGAASPIRVTGLSSNTAYTFTVTATNAAGTSAASAASSSVTATTVPATPSAPTATAGVDQDTVSWSAPRYIIASYIRLNTFAVSAIDSLWPIWAELGSKLSRCHLAAPLPLQTQL